MIDGAAPNLPMEPPTIQDQIQPRVGFLREAMDQVHCLRGIPYVMY